MKGLCPFHDEKTPSFQVTPSRGYWYCFGACGEGGDVIELHAEDRQPVASSKRSSGWPTRSASNCGSPTTAEPRPEPGIRMRLMELMGVAAEFFAEQLGTPDAVTARQFLSERGFDQEAAERFGVGFAPRDGRAAQRHLRGRGFTDRELVAAGLSRENGLGLLPEPGDVADPGLRPAGRRLRRPPAVRRRPDACEVHQYPGNVLYKKSHVLYGLDLARTSISKKSQAVMVEGYTDVMAAHLAGVDTAVASCGTAFGDDHARLLRRLMGDHDAFHGEVIFTFDGDAAGQAAAVKVFSGDRPSSRRHTSRSSRPGSIRATSACSTAKPPYANLSPGGAAVSLRDEQPARAT